MLFKCSYCPSAFRFVMVSLAGDSSTFIFILGQVDGGGGGGSGSSDSGLERLRMTGTSKELKKEKKEKREREKKKESRKGQGGGGGRRRGAINGYTKTVKHLFENRSKCCQ